jgi:hypothetical protein
MPRLSTRAFALAVGPIIAVIAIYAAPRAAGQTGPGWVSLFDGKTIGSEWDCVGETNWRVEDGAIVADKRTSQTAAHLVTKAKYKDFQLYVEFWASDDANSGIFVRCTDLNKIASATCYEVNIYDQRPEPKYGTGAIVDVAAVEPMPRAGGKWNTFEISAKGPHLVVMLNGQKTVDVKDNKFQEGPITLQYGGGVIKFRKLAVKPL